MPSCYSPELQSGIPGDWQDNAGGINILDPAIVFKKPASAVITVSMRDSTARFEEYLAASLIRLQPAPPLTLAANLLKSIWSI